MIVAVLPVLLSTILGWLVVRLLLRKGGPQSAWTGMLVTIPLAYAVGVGIASSLSFVLIWTGAHSRATLLSLEGLTIAGVAFLLWRDSANARAIETIGREPWPYIWLLRVAFVLAMGCSIASWQSFTGANPNGEWDAAAIWTLRAKFLASGEGAWQLAVAPPALDTTTGIHHPTYPILLSSWTAGNWTLLGEPSSDAPALASLGFGLAVTMLLAGAVAWRHSECLGLLAGLLYMASDALFANIAAQYADLPLSLYVLGAVIALEAAVAQGAERRLAALGGLCAGFAALTKNEGIVFLFVFGIVALWRLTPRRALWALAGCAPAIAFTFVFKSLLSQGRDASLPTTVGDAVQKIADPGRWALIAQGYVGTFADMGAGFAHPLLLLAILGFALRFVPGAQAMRTLWHGLPAIAVLAATVAVYLVTINDLKWQLDTSVNRVVAQVWPALLWMAFLTLRAPEDIAGRLDTVAEAASMQATKPAKRKKRE